MSFDEPARLHPALMTTRLAAVDQAIAAARGWLGRADQRRCRALLRGLQARTPKVLASLPTTAAYGADFSGQWEGGSIYHQALYERACDAARVDARDADVYTSLFEAVADTFEHVWPKAVEAEATRIARKRTAPSDAWIADDTGIAAADRSPTDEQRGPYTVTYRSHDHPDALLFISAYADESPCGKRCHYRVFIARELVAASPDPDHPVRQLAVEYATLGDPYDSLQEADAAALDTAISLLAASDEIAWATFPSDLLPSR